MSACFEMEGSVVCGQAVRVNRLAFCHRVPSSLKFQATQGDRVAWSSVECQSIVPHFLVLEYVKALPSTLSTLRRDSILSASCRERQE